MDKVLAAIRRYGPLLASVILGAAAVIPAAYVPFIQGLTAVLGVLGVTENPELVSNFTLITSGATALVGSVLKTYNLVKAKFFTDAPQ